MRRQQCVVRMGSLASRSRQMAVGGSYLAFQLRLGALPFFRVYNESILKDVLAGFVNLEQRADEVADAAFKRMASRPAMDRFRQLNGKGQLSRIAERMDRNGARMFLGRLSEWPPSCHANRCSARSGGLFCALPAEFQSVSRRRAYCQCGQGRLSWNPASTGRTMMTVTEIIEELKTVRHEKREESAAEPWRTRAAPWREDRRPEEDPETH